MEPNPADSSRAGTPLSAVPGLTAPVLTRLESRWLRSAEDVLSAAAAPSAATALQRFLDVDDGEFAELLSRLRAAVPAEVLTRLAHAPGLPGGELTMFTRPLDLDSLSKEMGINSG